MEFPDLFFLEMDRARRCHVSKLKSDHDRETRHLRTVRHDIQREEKYMLSNLSREASAMRGRQHRLNTGKTSLKNGSIPKHITAEEKDLARDIEDHTLTLLTEQFPLQYSKHDRTPEITLTEPIHTQQGKYKKKGKQPKKISKFRKSEVFEDILSNKVDGESHVHLALPDAPNEVDSLRLTKVPSDVKTSRRCDEVIKIGDKVVLKEDINHKSSPSRSIKTANNCVTNAADDLALLVKYSGKLVGNKQQSHLRKSQLLRQNTLITGVQIGATLAPVRPFVNAGNKVKLLSKSCDNIRKSNTTPVISVSVNSTGGSGLKENKTFLSKSTDGLHLRPTSSKQPLRISRSDDTYSQQSNHLSVDYCYHNTWNGNQKEFRNKSCPNSPTFRKPDIGSGRFDEIYSFPSLTGSLSLQDLDNSGKQIEKPSVGSPLSMLGGLKIAFGSKNAPSSPSVSPRTKTTASKTIVDVAGKHFNQTDLKSKNEDYLTFTSFPSITHPDYLSLNSTNQTKMEKR
ncbi:unnamed protein product [Owenia fusiformis]|uniref:Uncharacterized protein n=1 Tax=Owenia fusiformis TaxID=6347 RepID=A0A8J1U120_OWEFU|nr:unnamed protein product [Owenia fusiformis]